jgi:urease subunit beta
MIPGEMKVAAGDIELNRGRKAVTVEVTNSGDRPIQVGSHYHFFESSIARRLTAAVSTSRQAPRCASSRGNRARWN